MGGAKNLRHPAQSKAEQVYSLVAAMQTLRSAPKLIFASNTTTNNNNNNNNSSVGDGVDNGGGGMKYPLLTSADAAVGADILCDVFASQLMAHRSKESFHTPVPDGTLVGE